MYQYRVTPLLTAITMRVGSGSGTPALLKKAAKIGMMKIIRNVTTSTAMVMTRIGYTMAICTRCFSAWAFSRYVESRDSMESSTPPVSPTCTRLTYSSSKTRGKRPRASDSVEPDSTSYATFAMMSWKRFRSICMPSVCRHWTSGSPAAIIVANWRLKTEMSLPRTPPSKVLSPGRSPSSILAPAPRLTAMFWTTIPWDRSWRAAARSSGAVISARTCPPPDVTPRYVKFGMASPVSALAGGRRDRLVHHAEQLVRVRAPGQRFRP